MKESEVLRDKMVKKDELLFSNKHVIEDISKKMAQLESENVQDRFNDEKLRSTRRCGEESQLGEGPSGEREEDTRVRKVDAEECLSSSLRERPQGEEEFKQAEVVFSKEER